MKFLVSLSIPLLMLVSLNSCSPSGQKNVVTSAKSVTPVVSAKPAVRPYPLDTCMVIGAKLNSTPKTYTRVYKGQEVKFCCKSCIVAFEANPKPFLVKLKQGE